MAKALKCTWLQQCSELNAQINTVIILMLGRYNVSHANLQGIKIITFSRSHLTQGTAVMIFANIGS